MNWYKVDLDRRLQLMTDWFGIDTWTPTEIVKALDNFLLDYPNHPELWGGQFMPMINLRYCSKCEQLPRQLILTLRMPGGDMFHVALDRYLERNVGLTVGELDSICEECHNFVTSKGEEE